MKKLTIFAVVVVILGGALLAAYFLGTKKQNNTTSTQVTLSPTQTLLGGDRDEHGCIGSAGYTWCEIKQKCLREWEEACDDAGDASVNEEVIIEAVKEAIVAKHGPDAQKLTVTVSRILGDYAQGGASGEGGGGMWFAAKVNGLWNLVWDGNGIINCSDLDDYPDFPSDMIPACYNEETDKMVTR